MEYSKKFKQVKGYYDNGLWTKRMVYNAVGRWITAEEYEELTGEEFVESPVAEGEQTVEELQTELEEQGAYIADLENQNADMAEALGKLDVEPIYDEGVAEEAEETDPVEGEEGDAGDEAVD